MRASLAETACVLAESGALFHWHERRWRALANSATASGSGALGETLASGNGALVLMPHYGNWEFLGLYLGALAEHDVLALFQPQRFSSVTQRLVAARGRSGLKLAPMDRAGIRAAYRQLGSGGCLLLLPDQVPRRAAGVYAPFFGTPALTMTLAHRLIQRTRPEVFMAVAGRTSNGFEVTIQAMDDAFRGFGSFDKATQRVQAADLSLGLQSLPDVQSQMHRIGDIEQECTSAIGFLDFLTIFANFVLNAGPDDLFTISYITDVVTQVQRVYTQEQEAFEIADQESGGVSSLGRGVSVSARQRRLDLTNSLRTKIAALIDRCGDLLLHDLLVFLCLVVGLKALPGELAEEEVDQYVTQALEVVSPRLLDSQMGVDGGISSSAG